MFKGSATVSLNSTANHDEIFKVVEEELEIMGSASTSKSGMINVSPFKFSGFGYDVTIDGRITERNGRYVINLDFEAKPTVIAWIIAICFFPVGMAIFILPHNAKGDIQRKADQALAEVKYRLDQNPRNLI